MKDEKINLDKGKTEKKEQKVELGNKCVIFVYITFIIIGVVSYFLYNNNISFELVLGDNGAITNALLLVLAMTTFKWLPILSVVGLILYYNRKKIRDIIFLYLFLILFIFTTSVIILVFIR